MSRSHTGLMRTLGLLALAGSLSLSCLACDRPRPGSPPASPEGSSSASVAEPDSDEVDGERPAVVEAGPEAKTETEAAEADPVEAQPEPEAAPSGPVAHANVSMSSIEVDGMTIREFQCRIDGGGGLFGSMTLFATLSKSKARLDACAPDGAAPVVHWRFVGSKTEVVAVNHPSKKVATCVGEVMAEVPPTMEAECYATLLIGAAPPDK